jgi:N-acetylmuramoyl-L-alanine amidase
MSLWKEDLVMKNQYSRPGFRLLAVKGIIMHWMGTKGGTDEKHAAYFDGGGERYASAHIFIDKDSATLIIPLNEVAYHANEKPSRIAKLLATASYYKGGNANLTTIGIELCVEKDGTIHPNTVARAVQIVAYLCKIYKLTVNDIYRHYDITGKNCPAPWVSKPALFHKFQNDVYAVLNKKEEDEMLEEAIVIGGFPDFAVAEILSARLKAPVYTEQRYQLEKSPRKHMLWAVVPLVYKRIRSFH